MIKGTIFKTIIQNKTFKYILPFVLYSILIVVFTHKLTDGLLTYGDSSFYYGHTKFYRYLVTDNILGVNRMGAMFGNIMLIPIQNIFIFLSSSIILSSYWSFTLPLLLVFYSSYLLFYRISKNIFISLLAGYLIVVNNFILEQIVYWPESYFYNLFSLILLLHIMVYIYEVRKVTFNYTFLLISASIFCIHPFFFIIYLLIFTTFFVFMRLNREFKFELKKYFFIVFGILLINAYWLVPFVYSLVKVSAHEFYSGNLEAVLFGYIAKINTLGLLQYSNYPGKLNIYSTLSSSAGLIYYFATFILFCYLIYKYNHRYNGLFKYFIYIFIFFFILSMGPNVPIIGELWLWAFNNIPGLAFFRSYSRFFIVAIILLYVIIVKTSSFIDRKLHLYIVAILIFILSIITNQPFFSGDFNGYAVTAKIPDEYFKINQNYFEDNANYNIVSYPVVSYEAYDWSVNHRNDNTGTQVSSFNNYFFRKPIIHNNLSINLEYYSEVHKKLFNKNNDFIYEKNVIDELKYFNVRYILVRKDMVDILNKNIDIKYDQITSFFDNQSGVNLKENNKYFNLYEIKDWQKVNNITNIIKINPIHYTVEPSNIFNNELELVQNYDKGWQLFSEDPSKTKVFNATRINSQHKKTDRNTNMWLLPSNLKTDKIHIYYQPQIYYEIGLFITKLSLLLALIAIIANIYFETKNKKKDL